MRRREILQQIFADVPTKDLRTIRAAMLVCDGIIWGMSDPSTSAEETRNLLFDGAFDLYHFLASAQEPECAS